jgi:hypothetical protein
MVRVLKGKLPTNIVEPFLIATSTDQYLMKNLRSLRR